MPSNIDTIVFDFDGTLSSPQDVPRLKKKAIADRLKPDELTGDEIIQYGFNGRKRVEEIQHMLALLKRRGVRMSILSYGMVGVLKRMLDHIKCREYFDVIYGQDSPIMQEHYADYADIYGASIKTQGRVKSAVLRKMLKDRDLSKCLFIDDNFGNVDAAQRFLPMHVWQVNTQEGMSGGQMNHLLDFVEPRLSKGSILEGASRDPVKIRYVPRKPRFSVNELLRNARSENAKLGKPHIPTIRTVLKDRTYEDLKDHTFFRHVISHLGFGEGPFEFVHIDIQGRQFGKKNLGSWTDGKTWFKMGEEKHELEWLQEVYQEHPRIAGDSLFVFPFQAFILEMKDRTVYMFATKYFKGQSIYQLRLAGKCTKEHLRKVGRKLRYINDAYQVEHCDYSIFNVLINDEGKLRVLDNAGMLRTVTIKMSDLDYILAQVEPHEAAEIEAGYYSS